MAESHLVKMRSHLKAVPVLLLAIDEDELNDKPNPAKWSKKEILGHLVDSAIYNLERFTKIRFCEPPLEIVPYPQEELVRANRYQSQAVEDILILWETLNRQILSIWNTYSEKELKTPVIDPTFGNEGDLLWWIKDYSAHMEHHLTQIFDNPYHELKLWLTSSREAAEHLSISKKPFIKLLKHGSMHVEYYAPAFEDLQKPHDQDEIYVIDRGEGVFLNGDIRHIFEAGDVLFVP
ncbi:MAG: mannose-6-phosphate isomerase-like protein (cupin superfamily), partial [Saprospiraceae bacterium]